MDEIDRCPVHWPRALFDMEFVSTKILPNSPVNRPPEMERVLVALLSFAGTFHIAEGDGGVELRAGAKRVLLDSVEALSVK
jgi:hypothetical protein